MEVEIIADSPDVTVNPIDLTVAPGRTALVDLRARRRLEGVGAFTVAVRSSGEVPVAVSAVSVTGDAATDTALRGSYAVADRTDAAHAAQGAEPGLAVSDEAWDASHAADAVGSATAPTGAPRGAPVSGTAATPAADAAARRWLLPVEVAAGSESDGGAQVGFNDDTSNLVIVNPSSAGIAIIDLTVSGEVVRSLEVGPRRRARLPLAWMGSGRFVLGVSSSSPVITARELVGLTSRTASLGVAVSEPVHLTDLR